MTIEQFSSRMLVLLAIVILMGGLHLLSLMLLRRVRGEPWVTAQEKQRWRLAGLVMLCVLVGYFGFLLYLEGLLV